MATHRRNRWGDASTPSTNVKQEPEDNTNAAGGDDDAAVQALLAEAAAHEQATKASRGGSSSSQPPNSKPRSGSGRDGERNHRETPVNRHREGDYRSGSNKKPRRDDDYYGPSSGSCVAATAADANDDGDKPAVVKVKPDFGLSGALAADSTSNGAGGAGGAGGGGGSNLYKGVLLKFSEPPEARTPTTKWRLYVFKDDEQIDTLHIAKQSAYLFGRNEDIADVVLQHASCSSQHAVLQYRAVPNRDTGKLTCQPYLLDLESTNGSFINGVRIDPARYYQLKKQDVLKFGASTREYVLLAA